MAPFLWAHDTLEKHVGEAKFFCFRAFKLFTLGPLMRPSCQIDRSKRVK